MWINSFNDDIDDFDSWSEQTREQAWEKSEKKWDWGKGMAWVQKTRRDEKKAQKDNDFLYEIVVDIIQNKEYDIFIPILVNLLKSWISSNIIIWGFSLIYPQATYIIRNYYIFWNNNLAINKLEWKDFRDIINYNKTNEIIEFNDSNIHPEIKKRINMWIEDIFSVITFDPSYIVSKKFLNLIENQEKSDLVSDFLVACLTYFLFKYNISISKDKAFLYSEFIFWEIVKKLKQIKFEEEI